MNHKGLVVVVVVVCDAGATRRAYTVAIVLKFSLLECVIDEERRGYRRGWWWGYGGPHKPEEGPDFGPTLFSHLHAGDRGAGGGGWGLGVGSGGWGWVGLRGSLRSSVSEKATPRPPNSRNPPPPPT